MGYFEPKMDSMLLGLSMVKLSNSFQIFFLVTNSELLQLQPAYHVYYSWAIIGAAKQMIMFTSDPLRDRNSLIVELAGSVSTEMPVGD